MDIHRYIDSDYSCGLRVNDMYVGSPALADDVMLMSATKSGLDRMMDRAVTYSKLWRFRFSPIKSKCMVLGESRVMNNRNRNIRNFVMDGAPIEEVTQYCHVGITLSAVFNSRERTLGMCSKANTLLCAMTGIGVKRNGINPMASTFLWNRICILWNNQTNTEKDQLERAQCRALKQVQGLPQRTHGIIVRGLVNQLPIQSIIDIKKCNFFHKLLSMSNCLHKCLLLRRIYDYTLGRNITGFVPDVLTITARYDIHDIIRQYISGGTLVGKSYWKSAGTVLVVIQSTKMQPNTIRSLVLIATAASCTG